jgi:peptidoglycan hydrolase CwlO-like protein
MTTNAQGNAEKFMQDLGKRLDAMISDLHNLKEKAKTDYADEIEELKKKGDTIREEIDEFREKHKDRFDEIHDRLDRAAQELGKAIEAAFRRKESN